MVILKEPAKTARSVGGAGVGMKKYANNLIYIKITVTYTSRSRISTAKKPNAAISVHLSVSRP